MTNVSIEYTNKFLNYLKETRLEKLAAVSDSKEEQTKKELDLIRRIQSFDDPMAMKRLLAMYRATISSAIRSSGILSVMTEDNAQQEAIAIFRDKIKKYNYQGYLNGSEKATPFTYMNSVLTPSLQKLNYNNSGSGVRMSEELRGFNKSKFTAEQLLERQLNRKPTYEEVELFMKQEMGIKNKNLSTATLKRIDHYGTNEFSGSQTINGAEGAEKLTLSDVTSVSDNIQELYNQSLEEQMVESEIEKFVEDKNKQTLLKMNFGIGEYKNKKAKSVNEAAFNCGITYYEANKLISSFRKHISSKRGV